jgi:hypothetical protein
LLNKELNRYKKTGSINYQKISSILSVKSSSILIVGRSVDYQKISEESRMKLKLNRELRAKLIQLAALLLADASDGALDAADQTSRAMIETGREIRNQNNLPPI